jgi:predicted PhzF superfamily epimerase YddE/YHI9
MLPKLPFTLVNAFASTPHGGNPASVVLFPAGDPRDNEGYMSAIARDFNLSETVFLTPLSAGPEPHYAIRWFSPTVEVPLCGHGTLAAATALLRLHASADAFRFTTRTRGDVIARPEERGRVPRIALDFPILPATILEDSSVVQEVARIAGFDVKDVVRTAQFGDFSVIVEVGAHVDIGASALKVDGSRFVGAFSEDKH